MPSLPVLPRGRVVGPGDQPHKPTTRPIRGYFRGYYRGYFTMTTFRVSSNPAPAIRTW